MTKSLREQLLAWNNRWRYDYWYRQRYNVAFNSQAHRELNQIDIKLDYLEKQVADEQQKQYEQQLKDEEEYKKTGKWLRASKVDKELEERLFKHVTLDNID